jgi:hypothetical protein
VKEFRLYPVVLVSHRKLLSRGVIWPCLSFGRNSNSNVDEDEGSRDRNEARTVIRNVLMVWEQDVENLT